RPLVGSPVSLGAVDARPGRPAARRRAADRKGRFGDLRLYRPELLPTASCRGARRLQVVRESSRSRRSEEWQPFSVRRRSIPLSLLTAHFSRFWLWAPSSIAGVTVEFRSPSTLPTDATSSS